MQFSFRPHLYSKDDSVFKPIYKEIGIIGEGKLDTKRRSFCNRLLTNLYDTKAEKLIIHLSQSNYDPGTVYSQAKKFGVTSKIANRVIKLLFNANYIDVFRGDNSPRDGKIYSNVRPIDKLNQVFESIKSIETNDDEAVVKIKSKDGEEIFIDLPEDNSYLDSVIQTMDRYNEAVKNIEITYHPSECIEMFYPEHPNLKRKRLKASFKDSLNKGGRMNGGFWINLRKNQRPYLKIDGEDLIQFDLSYFFTAVLYNKIEEPVPDFPYIYEDGHHRRKIAKKLQNIMLNLSGDGRSSKQRINDVILAYREIKFDKTTGEIKEIKNPYLPRKELKSIIHKLEEKHYLIKDHYYTNCWGELQKTESDLMRSIMNQCLDKNIVILPIHDGFLCKESNYQEIEKILNKIDFEFKQDILKIKKMGIESNLLYKYLILYNYIKYNKDWVSIFLFLNLLSLPLKAYVLFKCSNIPLKREVTIPESLTTIEEKMLDTGHYAWVVDHKKQKAILVMNGYKHDYYSISEYNDLLILPEKEQPKKLKYYFWQ